jgi:hypothetical protein
MDMLSLLSQKQFFGRNMPTHMGFHMVLVVVLAALLAVMGL